MKTTIKKLKSKSIMIYGLVALLCMLTVLLPTKLKASALDFHGIDITGVESLESYYLELNLPQSEVYLDYTDVKNGITDDKFPHVNYFSRGNMDIEYIILFPYVTIENKSLYVGITINTNLPASVSYNSFNDKVKVILNSTSLKIPLSNNYYKSFKAKENEYNFSSYHMQMQWKGHGYPLYLGNGKSGNLFTGATYKLDFSKVPTSVVDIESPDFDINFGNTGNNLAPDTAIPDTNTNKGTGARNELNIVEPIASFFGISATALKNFFKYLVIGIIALISAVILIPIIVKLIKSITSLFK